MKKLFLLSLAILGVTFASRAQDIANHAIGLRLGDSDAYGAEVSYQHALGDNNRFEANIGLRHGRNFDAFKLTGLYQWVFPINRDFNWYAGAGGGISTSKHDAPNGNDISKTFPFAAGDLGIEYNFDFPLQISLDLRPEMRFGSDVYYEDTLIYNHKFLVFDIGIGARFRF